MKKPITPQLQLYPSELRRRLQIAERRLALQDRYIAQTQAQLELMRHLNTLIT